MTHMFMVEFCGVSQSTSIHRTSLVAASKNMNSFIIFELFTKNLELQDSPFSHG